MTATDRPASGGTARPVPGVPGGPEMACRAGPCPRRSLVEAGASAGRNPTEDDQVAASQTSGRSQLARDTGLTGGSGGGATGLTTGGAAVPYSVQSGVRARIFTRPGGG